VAHPVREGDKPPDPDNQVLSRPGDTPNRLTAAPRDPVGPDGDPKGGDIQGGVVHGSTGGRPPGGVSTEGGGTGGEPPSGGGTREGYRP
jgi:hypothetical protein